MSLPSPREWRAVPSREATYHKSNRTVLFDSGAVGVERGRVLAAFLGGVEGAD
jgi:hypothetical protein